MYFHKPQEKPRKWGSFQDVQYAVMKNCEKIYGVDPDSLVLAMPLFWGLPPMDYSGKNNHGTNHGATYKDGSLDFDGDNDYIDMGSIPSGHPLNLAGSDVSIFLRLNWDGSGDNFQRIIDKADGGIAAHGYSVYNNGNNLFLSINGDNAIRSSSDPLIANTCQDVAIIHINNSATGQIFVDNIETTYSLRAAQIIPSNTTNMKIGSWYSTGREFNGCLDEVHISNVARTADQIALFHDLPYGLYQPVSRPIYFFMAAGEEPSPGPGLMALMI